jgi:hypothetical protein
MKPEPWKIRFDRIQVIYQHPLIKKRTITEPLSLSDEEQAAVKAFIASELKRQQEEIVSKLEGMKEPDLWGMPCPDDVEIALDEAIKIVKKLK